MDARYPKALDLEAEVVEAMHRALHGSASLYAGTHAPEHFREALRGLRPIQIGELCRLATEPGREGHEAVAGVVRVLAARLGLEVVDAKGTPARGLLVEVAQVSEAASRLVLAVTEAVEDGEVGRSERAALLDVVRTVKSELADVETELTGR